MGLDYTTVTEMPGNRVTREQLERMFQRYCFARNFSEGKEILEVACGAGQGLGYLAKRAKRVFGGDVTETLVREAKRYYKDRVSLLRLDAHFLPFKNHRFDVVILYEAIYYLTRPQEFFDEARRVLRKDGVLLIATVNKDWSEFNPSPFSTQYFSIPELSRLLEEKGFRVEMYGGFSVLPRGFQEMTTAAIRRAAVALHLIPKTMKGKEFLKKMFYGTLIPLEEEIEEEGHPYSSPEPIPSNISNLGHKVTYAVARSR